MLWRQMSSEFFVYLQRTALYFICNALCLTVLIYCPLHHRLFTATLAILLTYPSLATWILNIGFHIVRSRPEKKK